MSRAGERWVATEKEPLGAVLARLAHEGALAEGRVFVNGHRADDAHLELEPGAVVEVHAARPRGAEARVLAEHAGLVFAEKPSGVATEPDRRGADCLVARVAALLGVPAERVHALSRLDLGVSGVVLLGLEREARRRVQELRAAGRLARRYVALSAGAPEPPRGVWNDALGKAGAGGRRAVVAAGEPALTHYALVARTGGASAPSGRRAIDGFGLLALGPVTGRTHQLRVHAAAHGAPLLGDRGYGGPARLVLPDGAVRALERVFLHAAWVELPGAPRVESPLPEELVALWAALGGARSALDAALDVTLPEPPAESALGSGR